MIDSLELRQEQEDRLDDTVFSLRVHKILEHYREIYERFVQRK